MGAIARRMTVTTDASKTGWGAVCCGRPARGTWGTASRRLHINVLELLAVFCALKEFLPLFGGEHLLVRTDNTTVVAYINRQGGTRSPDLFRLAYKLLTWASRHFLSIRAAHLPGVRNTGADVRFGPQSPTLASLAKRT